MRKALLLLVMGLLLAVPAFAQEEGARELTEVFINEDATYGFLHPEGWRISEVGNFVTAGNPFSEDTFIIIQFYGPGFVDLFVDDTSSLISVVSGMLAENDTMAEGVTTKPEVIELGDREVAVVDVLTDEREGFVAAIQFDNGDYGMVKATARIGDFEGFVNVVAEMLYSFNNPPEGAAPTGEASGDSGAGTSSAAQPTTPAITTADVPQSVAGFDGQWPDVVATLQTEGLIGTGSLVFQENRAFFQGQGDWYTPLARNSPFSDIVLAGTLNYTASDTTELETCSLLARVETTGTTTNSFIQVGLDNDGFAYYLDRFGTDPAVGGLAANLEPGLSQHFLIILQDQEMIVYLNGDYADTITVGDRAGTYGIALRGRGVGARCEGTNIWVYQAPKFTPGLCEVTSRSTVNKRSGPGTGFELAGQFQAGAIVRAVGQGSDGSFTWYELEDNTWVREDVVNVQGDCASLPQSN